MPNKRSHKYRYICITQLLILLISSSAYAYIPEHPSSLGSGNILSGAVGSGVSEAAAQITAALQDDSARQIAAAIIGAAAAKATGGNALTGAATAIEGEKNNRQLHKSEQEKILELASSYAKKNNITEEEAKQILMQTALRLVDDQWNKTYEGSINTEARDYLLANTRGLTFYNPETGTNQGFLTTTKEQYMDTTSLLHEAFKDGGINNYQKYAALGKNILDNIQYSAGVVSPAGVREESGQLKPSGVGKVGIETIREVINLGKTVLDAQTWTTLYNMIENAANDPGKAWESFKALAGQMPSEAVKKLESQWYEHELYRMQDRDFTAGQKVQEWTATVALAVVGTKGLDKLAKGGSLLKLGDKAEDLYSAAKQAEKVLPEGLAYRKDFAKHLVNDGFKKNGELFGTHNQQEAIKALQDKGVAYKLEPTGTPGISELKYEVWNAQKKDFDDKFKTVYDPKVYSDQKMLDMAQEAGRKGYENFLKSGTTKFETTVEGVNFKVYMNQDKITGKWIVGNAHPIK